MLYAYELTVIVNKVGVGVAFNAPPNTVRVISEAVFTANHWTNTDKQNSTGKYTIQHRKANNIKYSKTKLP